MRKKKILLIGPYPPPEGGVSIHLQRLLQKSVNQPGLELAIFDAKRRLFINSNGKLSGLISAILFFISASVVHVHLSHSAKVFVGRISKFFGKIVFFTQHNPRLATHSSTLRMIELSDQTFFVYSVQDFPDHVVIPAYIPAIESKPLPGNILEAIEGKKVVLTIGSSPRSQSENEDVYGFDILFEAIKSGEFLGNVLFIIIDVNGTYEMKYKGEIQQIINNMDKKNILYLTSGLDMNSLLSRTDVFVRATRSDGDSIAVREALQAGAAVVASDCVIRPEGCVLFRTNDPVDLAEKIIDSLNRERRVFEQEDYSERLFALYAGE